MKISRHHLGAAIAALTVATFAGSAFADDSGSTGGTPAQAETSLTTAPADQAGDTAATEQTNIASDTSTSSDVGATDTTTAGDSEGSAADTTSSTEEPTPPPPTETNGSGSNSEGTGSGASAACPSTAVINAHLSLGSSTATATFSIAPGCTGLVVTLASYTNPDPQALFDSATGTFNAGGPYTLTVNRPTCSFQVDLITGPAPSTSPRTGVVVTFLTGLTGTSCAVTPPTTPPGIVTPPVTTTTTTTETTTPTTTTETTTPTTTSVVTPTTSTPGSVAGEETSNDGNSNALGVAAQVASLPFTGFSLALVAMLGAFLLLLGIGLKLSARRTTKR